MCSTCDGVLEYRYGPGWKVAEVPPKQCHNGHELKPGRMLVGHQHGPRADGEHRTYTCQVCEDVTRLQIVAPRTDGPW